MVKVYRVKVDSFVEVEAGSAKAALPVAEIRLREAVEAFPGIEGRSFYARGSGIPVEFPGEDGKPWKEEEEVD
jgi:hypothetical protein